MLYFYSGTDREKARTAMNVEVKRAAKGGASIVRISDAHSIADVRAALQQGGMFGERRVVVLDGIFGNEEMYEAAYAALPAMRDSPDTFFVLEEKILADTRKRIEKYAEGSARYDLPGKPKDGSIFALAGALRRGDKKTLWIAYQRELLRDKAPEAIHGVLFWGAKDMFTKSRGVAHERAAKLLAALAELPHEARRHGVELEYALERFVLS